ncbi:MAG: hypothetical protein WCY60_08745, partial [Trueperaceae bacterium]
MLKLGLKLRNLAVAAVLVLGAQVGALSSAQGEQRVLRPAEVIVLDANGSQLLGYGQLVGNLLSLEVTQRVGEFVLLLVGPQGELERLVGSEQADGSLRLNRADGQENVLLADFFSGRN